MDTDYTDQPVCPHCGYNERDAWEIDFGPGMDGDTVHTCARYGEDYELSRMVTVHYSSRKP